MTKQSTAYFCSECGYESSGWLGRCPSCGSWNTLVEERRATGGGSSGAGKASEGWLGGARMLGLSDASATEPIELSSVSAATQRRVSSGLSELDRVLGGGFVPGSLILVGGEPGIGKSTLLLQVSAAQRFAGPALYVSGEESPQQIKMRAERLHVRGKGIKLLPEICFERVAEAIERLKPAFCVIDSIQTLYSEALQAAPGTVSQVRDVTAGLLRIAKQLSTTIVLLGHVTKDGALAGPRVLEHMVDTVLYFESEPHSNLRILRAAKNRFGTTNELGIFEMRQEGLLPLADASLALLSQRPLDAPGAAVTCCIEGTRPLLAEVQALAVPSAYGQPQRTVQGIERARLQMILAVMDNRLDFNLAASDVFINAVGGIRLQDTAADVALAAAIASSLRKQPLREQIILIGELGLTGELRAVAAVERRVQEALRLGYACCVVPGASRKALRTLVKGTETGDIVFADNLAEAMDIAFAGQDGDGNRRNGK